MFYHLFVPRGFCLTFLDMAENYKISSPDYEHHGIRGKMTLYTEHIIKKEERIMDILRRIEPIHMTVDDGNLFEATTRCHLCGLKFQNRFDKVRNHDHISGKASEPRIT